MKKYLIRLLNKFGYQLLRYPAVQELPTDLPVEIHDIYRQVTNFTQTSIERVNVLCEAVRYLTENEIEGDIVECGVWRGGSMMAIALMLVQLNEFNRGLHLFDTFEGMPPPSDFDVDLHGVSADMHMQKSIENTGVAWNYVAMSEVKNNLLSTGYPESMTFFVKGMVEDTLADSAPEKIALLRLDTDWYESTKFELETLVPKVVQGGVVVIDDYGHFLGARKAVDEYVRENKLKVLLNRIDYTGRTFVKTW